MQERKCVLDHVLAEVSEAYVNQKSFITWATPGSMFSTRSCKQIKEYPVFDVQNYKSTFCV